MFNSLTKVVLMMLLIFLGLGVVWTSANSYLTTPNMTSTNPVVSQTALARTSTTVPSTATPAATHRLVTLNVQNTRVAAVAENTVRVWALDSGKLLATFDSCNRSITDIAFSSDGLALAAGASDGSVLIWQVP